jgi:hypothetical protein
MPVPSASRLATPAALLLLLAGLAALYLYAAHDSFDADELQHAHLAWLVAGGKVPYRDFWDHHGPLFALANAALLALSGAPPGTGLLYACRAGALVAAAGILACTFGLARRVALPAPAALAAAALAATLVFLQDKAAECRPDGWQNLFWLAGLLVLAGPGGAARRLGAGVLFGLAVAANVKAGLGPLVVATWYLAGRRLHGLAPRAVAGELATLAAGGLVAWLAFAAWFAAQGAGLALHEYAVAWNFLALANSAPAGLSGANLRFLGTWQLPLLLLVAGGAVAWIADLRDPRGRLERRAGSLVLAAAAGTALSLALDFYYQFSLVFLPLWAIVAAFGLWRGGEWLAARFGVAGRLAAGALAASAAAALLVASWRLVPLEDRAQLRFQESFTRLLLGAIPRSEPVGVIWDDCGGFMFNEPVQFYWAAEPAVGATAARHSGRDPFAEDFVAALERGQVRYVVGREDRLFRELPAVTQRYLRERYRYANCLWTRRREPAAEAP